MPLHCPTCSTLIPAEDVNITVLVAKCRNCDEVFSFTDQVAIHDTGIEQTEVPKPKSLTVDESSNELRIVRRWFSMEYVGLVFFCIGWDAFLVFWYYMAFTQPNVPWIMVVFPIVHLAVGVGLTYTTIAGFFNRTVVAVNDEFLTVGHGPVPWPGNKKIRSALIQNLYCSEGDGHSQSTFRYVVHAVCEGGESIKLLNHLDDKHEGIYYAWQIEKWLGIRHQRVPGEIA